MLYRAASELLNNVVKHANANHAEVSLLTKRIVLSLFQYKTMDQALTILRNRAQTLQVLDYSASRKGSIALVGL